MSEETKDFRFAGTVDHIAINCDDLDKDVEEYKRLGFAVETVYPDWAMMRDSKGFGIALLPPESKHPPPHIDTLINVLINMVTGRTRFWKKFL